MPALEDIRSRRPVRSGIEYPRYTLDVTSRWLLGLTFGIATVAHADGPTLHEFIPDAHDGDLPLLMSGEGDDAKPHAIVYDGEFVAAPEGGGLKPHEVPLNAKTHSDSPGPSASPTFRPDRITAFHDTLGYYPAFSPSVAPFKRMMALDAVVRMDDGVPVLGVRSSSPEPVAVTGTASASPDSGPRDRFWGSVVLDFSAGTRVPLPSVAPRSQILSMRTEPPIRLAIEKDSADNYFARTLSRFRKQARLIFLVDAPRAYFNAPIPNAPSRALAGPKTQLPRTLREDALRFASEIGIPRQGPLPQVLRALARHFRSFVESDVPPPNTGSIYLDLARGRRGVCRHRAYAFVITALALGIPARFLQNEVHAWVEVEMPDVGFMRIDLGGAAHGVEAHGFEDRLIYQPSAPDPLPKPEAYLRSLSSIASAEPTSDQSPENATSSTLAQSLGQQPSTTAAAPNDPSSQAPPSQAPSSPSSNEASSGTQNDRRVVKLQLDDRKYEAFRGRTMVVSGRALDAQGGGASELRIEVRTSTSDGPLLGVTATDAHGWFHGSFGIPANTPVGDYRLWVGSPGDRRYAPTAAP